MTTQDTMNNFIGLSEVLTGFNASVIAPTLDPVDIKTAYFNEWSKQVSSETDNDNLVGEILSLFENLNSQKKTKQAIGESILANADYEFPCRQLIYLWYMGAWPTVIEKEDATRGMTSFDTLSSDSYTSGLVWQVMQAHPMGDSNYRYGYWGNTPAPLNDYTGNKGE